MKLTFNKESNVLVVEGYKLPVSTIDDLADYLKDPQAFEIENEKEDAHTKWMRRLQNINDFLAGRKRF